jgi:hypothetical protein
MGWGTRSCSGAGRPNANAAWINVIVAGAPTLGYGKQQGYYKGTVWMGKNSISLPRLWGYSLPPRQQPEHNTQNRKNK